MKVALIAVGAFAFTLGTAILTLTLSLYLGIAQQYGDAAASSGVQLYVLGGAVALIFLLVSGGLLGAAWRNR